MRQCIELISYPFFGITNLIGNFLWKYEKDPLIIIWIDGGMVSQILQYTVGEYYKDNGYKVKCNLSWYNRNGFDRTKTRKLILREAFPDIKMEEASKIEIVKYKLFYNNKFHKYDIKFKGHENEIRRPVIFLGYAMMHLRNPMKYANRFHWEYVIENMPEKGKKILSKIELDKTNGITPVGLHVRRGDRATNNPKNVILNANYYKEALDHINGSFRIYIFSDDFEWVKKKLIPELVNDFELVDFGLKDYEDFFAYSQCVIQIAGVGSWGRTAFCFNKNENKQLIIDNRNCYDEIMHYKEMVDDSAIKFINLTTDMRER